jgi:hypothetical protein
MNSFRVREECNRSSDLKSSICKLNQMIYWVFCLWCIVISLFTDGFYERGRHCCACAFSLMQSSCVLFRPVFNTHLLTTLWRVINFLGVFTSYARARGGGIWAAKWCFVKTYNYSSSQLLPLRPTALSMLTRLLLSYFYG